MESARTGPATTGRVLDRRIVALALPALGALVVEPLYNLTDSAIVGHLGAAPLGALAVATAALNVLAWTSAFLEMATVSAVSFRRSARDDAGAGRSVGAAYLCSAALGLVVVGLTEALAPVVVAVLGGHSSGRVATEAVEYLRIVAIGLPFLLVGLAGNGHLTGLADTRRPLVVALVANLVNVGAEIGLVYGAHLGIAGSALGTVVAQVVGAGLFALASHRAPVRPAWPGREEVRELLSAAVPLTVRTIALGLALLATTAIAARLGTAPLGGHQIAMQVWLMLALVLDSLAVPAQVFVAEGLGTGDSRLVRAVGRATLRMGLVAGLALGIVVAALAGVIPALFSEVASVRHEATVALVVCGLGQPLAAAAFVLDGLVLGAADYPALRRTMLIALVAFAPLAALTLADRRIGLVGVWLAMTLWLAARAGLLGWRWRRIVGDPALAAR